MGLCQYLCTGIDVPRAGGKLGRAVGGALGGMGFRFGGHDPFAVIKKYGLGQGAMGKDSPASTSVTHHCAAEQLTWRHWVCRDGNLHDMGTGATM